MDDIDREIALFKQSQSEEASPQVPVALRSHVEQVVNPLYAYCQSKVALLSGVFALTSGRLNIEGSDIDNKPFHVHVDKPVNVRDLPERAQLASLRISFALRTIESEQIFLNVRNEFRGRTSTWTFDLNSRQTSLDTYQGRDLEQLKLMFNQLLRSLMTTTNS